MAGEVARRSNAGTSRFGNDQRTIEPTRVVNPPSTEYVYVSDANSGGGNTGPSGSAGGSNYSPRRAANRVFSYQPRRVPVPNGVPRFLGDNHIVGYSWLASMILIGFDEWRNNGILPRPARLWYTSLIYGVLALAGMIPMLTPLVNAFAIGYTIMLLWQYFNGEGQFAK